MKQAYIVTFTSFNCNTAIQHNALFPGPSLPPPHTFPSVYELMAGACDVTSEAAHWASPGMVSCPATLLRDRKKPDK